MCGPKNQTKTVNTVTTEIRMPDANTFNTDEPIPSADVTVDHSEKQLNNDNTFTEVSQHQSAVSGIIPDNQTNFGVSDRRTAQNLISIPPKESVSEFQTSQVVLGGGGSHHGFNFLSERANGNGKSQMNSPIQEELVRNNLSPFRFLTQRPGPNLKQRSSHKTVSDDFYCEEDYCQIESVYRNLNGQMDQQQQAQQSLQRREYQEQQQHNNSEEQIGEDPSQEALQTNRDSHESSHNSSQHDYDEQDMNERSGEYCCQDDYIVEEGSGPEQGSQRLSYEDQLNDFEDGRGYTGRG